MIWKNLKNLSYSVVLFLLVIEGVGVCIAYYNYQTVSMQLKKVIVELERVHSSSLFCSAFPPEKKEKYQDEARQLVSLFRSLQFPLDTTMTPQLFQDKLRDQVSSIITKANKEKIKLPNHFYLGFDPYRSTLPPQWVTPELDLELKVISGMLHQLLEIPILSILGISRFPMPEESSFLRTSELSKQMKKKIFDICFMSDSRAFRHALNSILKFPHFLSIEVLQVINAQPHISLKKEEKEKKDILTSSDPFAKENMRLLFEKERLIITFRIAVFIL